MLQDTAQNLVETDVLVGECIRAHRVDLRVVTRIVGCDRIEPVAGAILAGLHEPGKIRGMAGHQVIEQLGLLFADDVHFLKPGIDHFRLVAS